MPTQIRIQAVLVAAATALCIALVGAGSFGLEGDRRPDIPTGKGSVGESASFDLAFYRVEARDALVERRERKARKRIQERRAERRASRLAAEQAVQEVPETTEPEYSVGPFAIPTYIVMCESGGDYGAENDYSTASGAYQIIDGTWAGYGGYYHASDAPPEVQDAKAAELWAGGAGASHWASCL